MKNIITIAIAWIAIFTQLAAQTVLSGESAIFTMDTKDPVLALESPNGGGIYSYLEPLNVTWSAFDDTFGAGPVSLGISTEAGGAVNWLSLNIQNSGSSSLDPPDIPTLFGKAHIYAVDAFGNSAEDLSDGYFELTESTDPPVAEFSIDITSGEAPLTVQFSDESTGDPTAWEWDFENDGSIDSFIQHPEFTYSEAGLYSVSLTAINDFGEDTKTQFNYITVTEPFVCLPPTDLTVSGITSHSATLLWNPGGDETEWEVLWGESGFNPVSGGNLIESLLATTTELTGLNQLTNYDFYVRAVCNTEQTSDWAGPETFTTEEGGPPDWEPVLNLQFNMQIIGQMQYPDGASSENENDIVGAFVEDECRGVISPNPGVYGLLFLTVGSNQQAGETVTFKAYIAETDEIVDLDQTMIFENQKQTGTIPDPFIFSWSDMISQAISLPQGWSGISSYVIPEDAFLENIFAPVENELLILQNFAGMYWPTAGVNTLGSWDDQAGYQVKMESAQQVTFSGSMQENLTANLSAGWNYLPVLNACSNQAEGLFAQISGNLQIVKEVAGTGVYWPQFGVNTLGSIVPGKTYFVLVDEDVSLEFPECTPSNFRQLAERMDPASEEQNIKNIQSKNTDVWSNKLALRGGTPFPLRGRAGVGVIQTPFTHTIAFPLENCKDLEEGDIITIYNQSGLCCGAAIFTNENLVLTAFGDDPTTSHVDGMVEGEPLQFRVFNPETGKEFPLSVVFDDQMPQGGYFVNHGLSAIKDLQITGFDENSDAGFNISIYPNPSADIFNIHFGNTTKNVNWEVTDIHGSIIARSNDQFNDFTIDISSHPKGIYYLKITKGGLQMVRKLVLQ